MQKGVLVTVKVWDYRILNYQPCWFCSDPWQKLSPWILMWESLSLTITRQYLLAPRWHRVREGAWLQSYLTNVKRKVSSQLIERQGKIEITFGYIFDHKQVLIQPRVTSECQGYQTAILFTTTNPQAEMILADFCCKRQHQSFHFSKDFLFLPGPEMAEIPPPPLHFDLENSKILLWTRPSCTPLLFLQ